MWMAGGGVKDGIRYSKTDDYGNAAVEDKMHIHDWRATVLHLLGLNHKGLTFNYSGRDFRLIDVRGEVAKKILAKAARWIPIGRDPENAWRDRRYSLRLHRPGDVAASDPRSLRLEWTTDSTLTPVAWDRGPRHWPPGTVA